MKPVKLLHTADLHLGYRQYGFSRREEDFYASAQYVFSEAVRHGVDAIILAGDIFDSTKPPAAAVWVMRELTRFAAENGVLVCGIDGNHDAANGNWLRICDIAPLNGTTIAVRGVTIGGIDGTRPSQFYGQLDAYAAKNERIHVMAIHQAISELSDFSTQEFTALQMANRLKPLGVEYVAAGDIHTPRETTIGGIRFAYSGSTEVNAIDEPTDKSVTLISFDDGKMTVTTLPIKTRSFLVCNLETNDDVDGLSAKTAGDDAPFVVGWYRAENREVARRAEKLLIDANIMCRILPYSGERDIKRSTATFERKGALLQLQDAVSAFFAAETDEHELIFRMLEAPDNVRGIVQTYMKSKGI